MAHIEHPDPRSVKWLYKIRTYIAPPIEVGSRWVCRSDKGNPFVEYAYEVEAVENGFVTYRYIQPKTGYRYSELSSLSVSSFRICYCPLIT
jgi:hypothetical protein